VTAFPEEAARRVVRAALDEDLGRRGDVTTNAIVPAGARGRARLVAREELVVAGLPLVTLVLEEAGARTGERALCRVLGSEGARATAGSALAEVEGGARAVLSGERLLLNLIGRLSGIASLTAEAVAEVRGSGARIADTRKTTPLLRALEKYAVAIGGGENHRATLDALVLVKDNHKDVAGGLDAVFDRLRAAGHDLADVEIEVDSYEEFVSAVEAGAGTILLDNMDPAEVRRCAETNRGRAFLEVSGGLRPGRLRAFADAGADRLSLGLLTHGARSKDVALDVVLEA
jgi:nicotinate-nucleotide pyrophosphorylase (carboxylating)